MPSPWIKDPKEVETLMLKWMLSQIRERKWHRNKIQYFFGNDEKSLRKIFLSKPFEYQSNLRKQARKMLYELGLKKRKRYGWLY